MAKSLRSKSLRRAKAARRAVFHKPVEDRRLERVVRRDQSRQALGTSTHVPDRILENDVAIALLAARIAVVQQRITNFEEYNKNLSTANIGPQFAELVRKQLEAALGDAEQAYKLNDSSYVAQQAVASARVALQRHLAAEAIDAGHESARLAEELKGSAPTFSFKATLDSIKSKTELEKELAQYRVQMGKLEKKRAYLLERKAAGKNVQV